MCDTQCGFNHLCYDKAVGIIFSLLNREYIFNYLNTSKHILREAQFSLMSYRDLFIILVFCLSTLLMGFPGGSEVKASACKAGDPGSVPGWGRSPGEGMATHSSILPWKIPQMEELGRVQSMGSQRVGHNWVTSLTHRSSRHKPPSSSPQLSAVEQQLYQKDGPWGQNTSAVIDGQGN